MNDQLQLEIEPGRAGTVIRVNGQAAAILDALIRKTGRPVSEIASEMIAQAAKHVELTERKLYDMKWKWPEV